MSRVDYELELGLEKGLVGWIGLGPKILCSIFIIIIFKRPMTNSSLASRRLPRCDDGSTSRWDRLPCRTDRDHGFVVMSLSFACTEVDKLLPQQRSHVLTDYNGAYIHKNWRI